MRSLPINILPFPNRKSEIDNHQSPSPRFLPVDLSAIDKQPVSELHTPPAAPTEADITPQEWTRRGLAALKRMEGFIGGSQLAEVRRLLKTSEEREFFALKMEELATLIEGMPVSYQQDGKGDDAICYLHYFCGGYDGYIIEKDSEPASNPAEAQWQAYGFARFAHMAESADNGYICLPEIFKSNAELDFHFTPTPLREIKAKFGIETTPATLPEIQTPPVKPLFTDPRDAMRYHVTGAIERGEGEAIVEIPAEHVLIARQKEFLAMDDGYQPGAIISSSWGWEQTNIDFYRIEKRSKNFITLIPLKQTRESTGCDQGKAMPTGTPKDYAKDHDVAWPEKDFDNPSPTFRRKLQYTRADGNPSGCTISHGWASLWIGQPEEYTSYA
jgi:hypothetical protein